jgi:hypothetical protein
MQVAVVIVDVGPRGYLRVDAKDDGRRLRAMARREEERRRVGSGGRCA